jgi:hypothetical protein
LPFALRERNVGFELETGGIHIEKNKFRAQRRRANDW